MKKVYLFILFLMSVSTIWADKIQFRAEAPDAVVKGDQFRLTYTINSLDINDFRISSIRGFEVLMGPTQSTQSYRQIINGNVSSSQNITFTYILLANEVGTFSIPAASVEVGGKKYISNAVRIKVLPPNSKQSSSSGGAAQNPRSRSNNEITSNSLFIRVIPSKTTVREQEAFLLTYKLYSQVDLQQLDGDMPELTGFHAQEIPLPNNKSWTLERYNGVNYKTIIWKQYVLFPQQTGKLEIPSVSFDGTIRITIADLDDSFIGLMNGSAFDYVKKKIVAPKVIINVQPLPKKPAGFSGGVGNFSITSSLSSDHVRTNDAITLKVTISGNGNLKLVNTPDVKFPEDFETYDPKVNNDVKSTTQGVTGTKTIEYLAVPRTPGNYTIPPVQFTYFDTSSNSYKTISTQSYTIDVKKGNGNANQVIADYTNKESVKMLGNDVRYIQLGNTKYVPRGYVFFGTTAFYLWYILPFIVFVIIVILFRRKAIENANVSATRTRKANKMALRRMKQAGILLKANKQNEFYDEVLKALWGYVSDKLNIPVATLSKDNIASELSKKGVPEEVIAQFIDVLKNCEFARYAPGNQNEAMDKAYAASLDIITKIDNSIKMK